MMPRINPRCSPNQVEYGERTDAANPPSADGGLWFFQAARIARCGARSVSCEVLGLIEVSAFCVDRSHSSSALLTSDKRNIFRSALVSAYAALYRSPKLRNSAFFIS